MDSLWVVEALWEGNTEWVATAGTKLTLEEGRMELRQWKMKNPNDEFRLVEYVLRVQQKGKSK